MFIEVISREDGSVQQLPLSFDERGSCSVHLELAPGASAVQVAAREGDEVAAAIEIAAQPGEQVTIEFRRDSQGTIRPMVRNLRVLVLPSEKPAQPLILVPPSGAELDLAILVDGTCLQPAGNPATTLEYLLSPPMALEWESQIAQLAEFVSIVSAQYPQIRITALAFGDEPMEDLANELLMPAYLVYPPPHERAFVPALPHQAADAASTQLRKLQFTSGGDFIDALADGLRACGELPWRQKSRRLVLLFGQSPGYSILERSEELASLIPRSLCIEEEVASLHQKRIELVTIFHHPWKPDELYRVSKPQFVQYSRRQYQRLASLPHWAAMSGSETDIRVLARQWLSPPASLARGPSPGLAVEK